MDLNTLFIIFAVLVLVFCVGPMLFMRRRHRDSTNKVRREPETDVRREA